MSGSQHLRISCRDCLVQVAHILAEPCEHLRELLTVFAQLSKLGLIYENLPTLRLV